jgi:hypothetical protein
MKATSCPGAPIQPMRMRTGSARAGSVAMTSVTNAIAQAHALAKRAMVSSLVTRFSAVLGPSLVNFEHAHNCRCGA